MMDFNPNGESRIPDFFPSRMPRFISGLASV